MTGSRSWLPSSIGGVPDDDDLLAQLSDELLRLGRRRGVEPTDAELEHSAFRILWALARFGPRTLRDLADDLLLEQSTINRQVNRAIDQGYVERFTQPGQASRYLRPTILGQERYARDVERRRAVQRRALALLGEERAARLVADLRLLNDAFDEVTPEQS